MWEKVQQGFKVAMKIIGKSSIRTGLNMTYHLCVVVKACCCVGKKLL